MEKENKGKFPGWRTMSSSSRYNAKLHHTFSEAKRINAIHDAGRANHVAKGHGGVETYSSCKSCFPTDKGSVVKKALEKARGDTTKPNHKASDCGYKCVFHNKGVKHVN